jgi:DNA-directed RNA polymerase sigma subunit (sigma70/sigma32)
MRRVLALRFGLDGEVPQTLEEVGAGLGITR